MKKLIIIAAIGKNGELGYNNNLIWHIKEDLKFFKEQTINHTIIMGRNTFESLPKLLPNRHHIVLTHHKEGLPNEVEICQSYEEAIDTLRKIDDNIYCIGGASIYKLFLNDTDEMLLTEIDETSQASVYFPEFDKNNWERQILSKNEENAIKYAHVKYLRK